MDTTNVANPRGLDAVGVLLLLLNILYIIAMALLVLVTGAHKTKRFTQAAIRSLLADANRFGRSVLNSVAGWRWVQGAQPRRLGTRQVSHRHSDSSTTPSTNSGVISSANGSANDSANGSANGSANESGSSSIWHHQRSRAGETNNGTSMQLSLLHPATDSSMTPEWVMLEDAEILQHSGHDRTARNRLPALSVLPHEHDV
jgi:hypothetical protein